MKNIIHQHLLYQVSKINGYLLIYLNRINIGWINQYYDTIEDIDTLESESNEYMKNFDEQRRKVCLL